MRDVCVFGTDGAVVRAASVLEPSVPYTRAKIFGSILSFERSMKKEPTMTLVPERTISPVYDPWVTLSSMPAVGFPMRDL